MLVGCYRGKKTLSTIRWLLSLQQRVPYLIVKTRKIRMPRKTHHVVPNSEGGWDIKKGGGQRSIKHFDKKTDAVSRATEIAKKKQSELIIHKKDGTIQNPNSFGGDPCPPKDKK